MFWLRKGQKTTFLFEVQFRLDIRPYFQGAELLELTFSSVAVARAQARNIFPLTQNFETSQFSPFHKMVGWFGSEGILKIIWLQPLFHGQ